MRLAYSFWYGDARDALVLGAAGAEEFRGRAAGAGVPLLVTGALTLDVEPEGS